MKKQLLLGAAVAVTVLMSACSQGPAEVAGELEPQFGTAGFDEAQEVVTDNARGRVYAAGIESSTNGSQAPGYVFLRSFDTAGRVTWSVKLASEAERSEIRVQGTDIDAAGNVYVAWRILNLGTFDNELFTLGAGRLAKVSPSGRVLYTVTLNSNEGVGEIDADASGNVYVAIDQTSFIGYEDPRAARLRKYDANGKLVWERKTLYQDFKPVSNPQNIPAPLSLSLASNGTLFVVGDADVTDQNGPGVVLTRYSSAGRTLGQTAIARSNSSVSLAASGDAIFLEFIRNGDARPILQKRDLSGVVLWEKALPFQLQGNGFYNGYINDLAGDAGGNVYLAGAKEEPEASGGGANPLALKYTPSGSLVWTYAPSTEATNDPALAVAAQANGNTYIVGSTNGKVNGVNRGSYDAFLTKLSSSGRPIWFR